MSTKYYVHTNPAAPRFFPVTRFSSIENDGCLGCVRCVKRDSCVYDVYMHRKFDANQFVDTADITCMSCMRCVQECKKNILFRMRNPQYDGMGNDHWKPDIIASIWKQAETGKIPVSGAGYRGRFAGPGFDRMWTDMSEIVRPTRDGIHGREYISTVIELGRHPAILKFGADGSLLTNVPSFIEIPIPMVLDLPKQKFVSPETKKAMARAAMKLKSYAIASFKDAVDFLWDYRKNLIVKYQPSVDDAARLKDFSIIELQYCEKLDSLVQQIKKINPDIIVSIRVPLDQHAVERAVALASDIGEVLYFQADDSGWGSGKRKDRFVVEMIKEIHFELVNKSLRDQVTVLTGGGIAMAEHAAKSIACGCDGVGVDTALAVALECRLCGDCRQRNVCPVSMDDINVEWGAQRIVNLLGSWHSQLIEVLGAMGIREVRRLRGELGRIMTFESLEKDNFAGIFGDRTQSLVESLSERSECAVDKRLDKALVESDFDAAKDLVSPCQPKSRNKIGKYKVVRSTACIACGKCAEVCKYGVHNRGGNRMLAPKSYLCAGADVCRSAGAFCVDNCPVEALKIGIDPTWETFGDPRWPADLLTATWMQAETGKPPVNRGLEYRVGNSGGGFDKIAIAFPDEVDNCHFSPKDVDLSLSLNRRTDENRPDVTIGVPFYGGGMSFGSISLATMVGRAKAYAAFNSFTCSGEGGYPEALKEYDDHVVTQIATGLFGVREDTIQRVRMVEFKYAQGAKPGLGGHLLGDKVTASVAKMREAVQGSSLFSPFPFHSVYSVEDHKKHVDWIKEINPDALVSVKVAGASDVDMVAVGSFYAGAHVIHIDGSYGGTGAAPDIAKKNIAMPIEYAVPKVHQFLAAEGVRDKITFIASGGLRSAWDVVKAVALGADGVVIGTPEVVALGCVRCGVCESGRGCPRGIASTDTELSNLYDVDWAYQRLVNLFHSWAVQLQCILWRLGLRSIKDLVGRTDLLVHVDYDNKSSKTEKCGALLT